MFITNLYKVLSFVLLPIGALFGMVGLFSLLSSLGNPYGLLSSFLIICTSIYIFTSFIFVYKGIISKKLCSPSLKDWIKVNGYVSLFVSSSCIIDFIALKLKPSLLQDFTNQALTMKKGLPPEAIAMMPQIINSVFCILLGFGIILFVHITMSLAFIKTKSNIFSEE